MRLVPRTLSEVVGSSTASVASSTKAIDLPRDNWIRRVILKHHIVYNTGATTPVLDEDNPFSGVTNLRLVAGLPNGNKDVMIDGSLASIARMNTMHYQQVLPNTKTSTTTSQTGLTVDSEIVLDFAQVPKNKWDASAMIPAKYLSSLRLEATFGADSTLASNTTTTAEYLTVTLEEAILSRDEEVAFYGSNLERLVKIYLSEQEKTIDAAYSNYNFRFDLPVGDVMQQMLITAVNNSVRSEAICTAWKIRREAGGGLDAYQSDWMEGQFMDVAENGLDFSDKETSANVLYRGVTTYDPTQSNYATIQGVPVGGLDLRGLKSGDYAFRANVGSPTSTAKFKYLIRSISPF